MDKKDKVYCFICEKEAKVNSKYDKFAWLDAEQDGTYFCDLCLFSRQNKGVRYIDSWVYQERDRHHNFKRPGYCDYCHTAFTCKSPDCEDCYYKKTTNEEPDANNQR